MEILNVPLLLVLLKLKFWEDHKNAIDAKSVLHQLDHQMTEEDALFQDLLRLTAHAEKDSLPTVSDVNFAQKELDHQEITHNVSQWDVMLIKSIDLIWIAQHANSALLDQSQTETREFALSNQDHKSVSNQEDHHATKDKYLTMIRLSVFHAQLAQLPMMIE